MQPAKQDIYTVSSFYSDNGQVILENDTSPGSPRFALTLPQLEEIYRNVTARQVATVDTTGKTEITKGPEIEVKDPIGADLIKRIEQNGGNLSVSAAEFNAFKALVKQEHPACKELKVLDLGKDRASGASFAARGFYEKLAKSAPNLQKLAMPQWPLCEGGVLDDAPFNNLRHLEVYYMGGRKNRIREKHFPVLEKVEVHSSNFSGDESGVFAYLPQTIQYIKLGVTEGTFPANLLGVPTWENFTVLKNLKEIHVDVGGGITDTSIGANQICQAVPKTVKVTGNAFGLFKTSDYTNQALLALVIVLSLLVGYLLQNKN